MVYRGPRGDNGIVPQGNAHVVGLRPQGIFYASPNEHLGDGSVTGLVAPCKTRSLNDFGSSPMRIKSLSSSTDEHENNS